MVVYSMMAQAVTTKILPPYRPPYEAILLDFIRFLTVFGGYIYTDQSIKTCILKLFFLKKGLGLWKNGLVKKIVNFFFPIIMPPYFFRLDYRILKKEKASKTLIFWASREAQAGFEPARTGVADHCLTTWLLRHI